MRLKIQGTPAAERRGLERAAFAGLGIGALLGVVGLVSLGTSHKPAAPQPAPVQATAATVPPAAVPPPPVQAAAEKKPEPVAKPEVESKPSQVPPEQPRPVVKKTRSPVEEKVWPASTEPKLHGFELRSRGAMIVLARDEATALHMRRAPGQVTEMVAQGRVFSAPNHTAVFIEEVRGNLMRVRILHDSLQGRVGWVRADQVARW